MPAPTVTPLIRGDQGGGVFQKPKNRRLDLRTCLFTIRRLNFPPSKETTINHPLIRRCLILALLLASIGISYADFDAGEAAYERHDYATALREFRPLAEQGNAEAQNILSSMYYIGQGVAQDYKAAFNWRSKAAEQGHAEAQYSLGMMYYSGLGVAQDYNTAFNWCSKAAQQGQTWAQYNLGNMYREGQGVAQDYKAAVQWYRKAAEQGYADAQHRLGVMYALGKGVPQDNIRAHIWANLAVSNGMNTEARDEIAKKMTTDDIEKAQRLARDCAAKNYQDC